MGIDAHLLESLVCPVCHGEVRPVGAADGPVGGPEEGLECLKCGRIYPIEDGIPVMLVDRASAPTREERAEDPDS